jgi:hypothetical protein
VEDFHLGAYQEGDRQDLVGQDHLDGIQEEVLTCRLDHQDRQDRLGRLSLGVSTSLVDLA